MFECTYCNLNFDEKKTLLAHQKTKKCTAHRNIGFLCQKCFRSIKGYDNALNHVQNCNESVGESGVIMALLNQLAQMQYSADVTFTNKNEGSISFKKMNNYKHPKVSAGISVPQKPYLLNKCVLKYSNDQIIGSHNDYINDIYNKIFRLSDTFQLMSVKCSFSDLLGSLFLSGNSCFHFKDDVLYVLAKVQCQNAEGQKWFGDTFILKEDEKIVKCVWYKDSQLKQFFSCLTPLLKDLLNLYLTLGNYALKQRKIRFKNTANFEETSKIISECISEYNYTTVVDNLRKLYSYELTLAAFQALAPTLRNAALHSNIQHVFKDELLPANCENCSLMVLNDPQLHVSKVNSAKGLLILEEEDFELVEAGKVNHLVHTVESKYSIVMFYTDECDQCKIIKPVLLSFVGNPTIQICMVNVYDPDSTNLIQLSQKSSTPLQHVPFIVFYINGTPFKKYDGGYNLSDFQTFVKNVMAEASKIKDTSQISDIPPYTIGKPNSSKVCYLTYQKAY